MALFALRCRVLTLFKNTQIQVNNCRHKYWEVFAYGKKDPPKKHVTPYGLQVHSGCRVQEKDIIVIQRRLNYHPGLNTGIDPRDNSLYAVCDGTLMVTTEKFSPNKDHEIVQKYYADLKGNMYKKYVHVIPNRTQQIFKLIDVV